MTKIELVNKLIPYLESLYPDAKCSLEYNKDYELLIAVMLSAQTTDKAVNKVTKILFKKYDSLNKIANANIDDIEIIIKSIGMYKTKAKNIILIAKYLLENFDGKVINNHDRLIMLPGVGNKTANVVCAELFKEPKFAVDTHVTRITKKLGIASKNDDVLTIENKLYKYVPRDKIISLNHQIIYFGRNICTAKNPKCLQCKMLKMCANHE